MLICGIDGCTSSFESLHGLETHRGRCLKKRAGTTNLFQEHKNARLAVKDAQERAYLGPSEPDQDVELSDADAEFDVDPDPDAFEGTHIQLDDRSPSPHDPGPSVRKRTAPSRYKDYQPSSESAFRKETRLSKDKAREASPLPSIPEDTIVDVAPIEYDDDAASLHPASRHSPDYACPVFVTAPSEDGLFNGMYRVYRYCTPSRDPDAFLTVDDVADGPNFAPNGARSSTRTADEVFGLPPESHSSSPQLSSLNSRTPSPQRSGDDTASVFDEPAWAPLSNLTTFRILDWADRHHNTGPSALNDLVHGSLLQEGSSLDELRGFDAHREYDRLHQYRSSAAETISPATSSAPAPAPTLPFLKGDSDVWYNSSVSIPMPCANQIFTSEEHAPRLEVAEVHHRKITEVLITAFKDQSFFDYHIKPFKQFWKPSENESAQRIFSETYSSDRALQLEREVYESLPSHPEMETVVAWAQLWSDSTHLASFGTASLWPVYLYFGNLSKYMRCKPSAFAAHHLAYIPKIPDTVKDVYYQEYGVQPTPEVLRFLNRELVQAIWLLLLDEDCLHAYIFGIPIDCADDIVRLVVLRFYTYSADYMEKILLACIKQLATCLCARCLVLKSEVSNLGLKRDMKNRVTRQRKDSDEYQAKIDRARKLIFESGRKVESTAIKNLLNSESLTPTKSAFSTRLRQHGMDFLQLFCPDLLHEWKGGKVKDIITHLVRMLHFLGDGSIKILDQRYRWVPTFGRSVIRRFHNNVSEMKKLAGRDYEDILQCAMPCFENLFPRPYDQHIQDLLFDCGVFLSYGALRLHWDSTLISFEDLITELGQDLRLFTKESKDFNTKDLPRELEARKRRKTSGKSKSSDGPKLRHFNNNTAKTHVLGDYPWAVRYYGTMDGWCTSIGECEHRRVKRFYAKTNKHRIAFQIAKQTRRAKMLRRMRQAIPNSRKQVALSARDDEPLPFSNPSDCYHIATGKRYFEEIPSFIADTAGDPATVDFLRKLKDHILCRLTGDESFSSQDRDCLRFENDRLYKHKVVRINYTTYDFRRCQDSINPRTHPEIMILSPEGSSHPFTYGRVIGVFHAHVHLCRTKGSKLKPISTRRINFLWVRWYHYDTEFKSGWKAKRLHRIQFYDGSDSNAFGFLDPAQVVRGIHLIPAYNHGGTGTPEDGAERADFIPSNSIARQYQAPSESGAFKIEEDDWVYYYVNLFVDRDMFILFRGGGPGHSLQLRERLWEFAVDAGLDDQVLPIYDSDGDTVCDEEENRDDLDEFDAELESGTVQAEPVSDEEELELSGDSGSESDSETDEDEDEEAGPEDEWEDVENVDF